MYHSFIDENGNEYGAFEVFEVGKTNVLDFAIGQYGKTYYGAVDTDLSPSEIMGFYWWPCLDGCLPDGEAIGPFKSETEAIEDAQN
jgi:hypothetical protein